ncbi:hypothetical protein J4459_01145 [Candidatus Woesearchaeota archaeon]|nr:hypothetical protein [Candidatus Woesearchaeota archaeon]
MAKKRTSKKTFIGKNSPSQLNTKNILIIVLVVAVLLILISSYTGNASRRSFRSPRAMGNSMIPSQGSGGSDSAGAKTPAENEGPSPCNSENTAPTGITRCSSNGRFVMTEYRCSVRDRPEWRHSRLCRGGQVCQMDGNSASCQDPECENTETRECRGEINRWGQTQYYIDFVTRDCNGQNVSTRSGGSWPVCVDGTYTSFSCNGDNISPVARPFNCNGDGCSRDGRNCCYPTREILSSNCEGNTIVNQTITDASMCVPSIPRIEEETRDTCPANTVCTEINNIHAECR